jgi:hypothetical protein
MQMRRGKHLRLGAVLVFAAVMLSACGGQPGDEEEMATGAQPLWQMSGASPWAYGFVPVCFQASVPAALRTTIRNQIEGVWEAAARINFYGFGDCPASIANGNVAVSIDASIGALGLTTRYYDPTAGVTTVKFASTSPSNKTILHEFGHVLGFDEENSSYSPCTQRTSGGTSLEGEPDMPYSVMTQSACNSAAALSPWDILGARQLYGQKDAGAIAGLNGLVLNVSSGTTDLGNAIVAWPNSVNYWNDDFRRPSETSLLLLAQTGSTQRCLNVAGGTVGTGLTPLVSWDCGEAATNEQFHFLGVKWLAMGNRCVQADSASSGALLTTQACSTSSLQKWDFFEGNRRIRLNGTNLCVTVPNGSTSLGTRVQLATCGSSYQTYGFANSYINYSNVCLNVLGGTTANGNGIGLWNGCGYSPAYANEQFTIKGPITSLGQCVTMNGSPYDGVPVGVSSCNSSTSQAWEYYW